MLRKFFLIATLLGTLGLSACSGGGGSSTAQGGLQLTGLSVQQGGIWQINREIEFTFNAAIDFSTVSFNTISIQTPSGTPANGTFTVKMIDTDGDGIPDTPDPARIVFQPTCPTKADLSDAGLKVGTVLYEIVVAGHSSGAQSTIRSVTGQGLATTQRRTFVTPASSSPNVAFLDTVNGPPAPVIRNKGSMEMGASYVEIGGDDQDRVYFEFDAATQTFSIDRVGFEVPLNLYSDPDTGVVVYLYLNQPVSPLATNINSKRVRMEFLDGSGIWRPIDTDVQLLENCTSTGGAIIRLEALGVLPAGSSFRVVLLAGFQDLSGETSLIATNNFSNVPTETIAFASLSPASDGADELLEEFAIGGAVSGSFEDVNVLFDTSAASWGNEKLAAGFRFAGTGGPNGDFDLVIPAGVTLLFDTTSTQVVGGPGGIPAITVTAIGGVLDVRNLIIETGATLRATGPNPLRLNVSGFVRLDGRIDASGFKGRDVGSLNTGHIKEIGGQGAASGGDGGDASAILNNSTPRGGQGFGAFGSSGAGGQGGEAGYAPKSMGKNARRPGGGGGGGFGPVVTRAEGATVHKTFTGQSGFNGDDRSRGAESNTAPSAGGGFGPIPFVDGDPSNDFFGIRPLVVGPSVTLIQGELPALGAGSGGGGGGDAIPANQFPHPTWNITTDEKGGPGGGAGGAIVIRALGDITFGTNGQIACEGGSGGAGENTLFLDHVGGSGGGGSGGHVIVESASVIDFSDGGANNPLLTTSQQKTDGFRYIIAAGGPGGIGFGGAKFSKGGRGGPGIVQLHVPDPTIKPSAAGADILVPTSAASTADPLVWVSDPPTFAMVPTFGARSKARSKWISIGGADQAPGGGLNQLSFFFDGTDTTTGSIDTVAGMGVTAELAPILGGNPGDLVGSGNDAVVRSGGLWLDIANTSATLDVLINDMSTPSRDIYLRTPDLLKNFTLRLKESAAPANLMDFTIVDATFDDAGVSLSVLVDSSMDPFISSVSGTVDFAIIPRFFRVATDGVADALVLNSDVKIFFEATGADVFGNPDITNITVPLTPDISLLNAQPAGAIQFFRFQVEFDLDSMGGGLTVDTKPVDLDYLRMPFRF